MVTTRRKSEEVKVKKCYDCGGMMHGTRTYYRYTECGLDCITLENIYVYRCSTCGAIVPEIPASGELHRVIVLAIIQKKKLLSAQEIKFLRKMTGLSGKELCATLGVSASTISRWENGSRNISKRSDAALRLTCFAGMLQDTLRDKELDIVPKLAAVAGKMSELNLREILTKIVNTASGPVPQTIDPNDFLDSGPRKEPAELSSVN